MELVDEIITENGQSLQLLKGDLTQIPTEYKVDLLIISAFPGDYFTSTNSAIGALGDAGLSVGELANDMEADSRSQSHCWLSKEINFRNIKRILCFEPRERKNPYNLIAGVFQSIAGYGETYKIKSVAMPLILTGDQGYAGEEVAKELVSTSLFWLRNDSTLNAIRIVERDEDKIVMLKKSFQAIKSLALAPVIAAKYDFFISYDRSNGEAVKHIYDKLKNKFNIFFDQESIDLGANWVNKLNKSMANSERFIICLSKDYIESVNCAYEYSVGCVKMIKKGDGCLLPVYLYSTELPDYMQVLNYHDATEGREDKMDKFCEKLIDRYGSKTE